MNKVQKFYTISRFYNHVSKPWYNGGHDYYSISDRDFLYEECYHGDIPIEARIPHDSNIDLLLCLGACISRNYQSEIEDIHLRLHERVLSKTSERLLKASKIYDINIDMDRHRNIGEKREIIFGENNTWEFV